MGEDVRGLQIQLSAALKERDEARARERGQMAAILHTIGGEVEGHPTSAIDYLQRLRALAAIEQALKAAVNYSAYSGDPNHLPSCDSTVYSRKPCDCWIPQARAALAGTVTAAESERDALRAQVGRLAPALGDCMEALAAANARADAAEDNLHAEEEKRLFSELELTREQKCRDAADEALAAARRDLPVGLEWQAILDALLFTERECGLVSDAHLRVRPKVEALTAPAASEEKSNG